MYDIPWFLIYDIAWASLVAQTVKNLPAMQATPPPSLGWEDPLEKEMATQSSILAWRIPWTEEPGRLQSMGLQRAGHDRVTNTFIFCRASEQASQRHINLVCGLFYAKGNGDLEVQEKSLPSF